jgi:hypothetical protein
MLILKKFGGGGVNHPIPLAIRALISAYHQAIYMYMVTLTKLLREILHGNALSGLAIFGHCTKSYYIHCKWRRSTESFWGYHSQFIETWLSTHLEIQILALHNLQYKVKIIYETNPDLIEVQYWFIELCSVTVIIY